MSKHRFGTKFDTLGCIAAEILVILNIHALIFVNLSPISKVSINIHEYVY